MNYLLVGMFFTWLSLFVLTCAAIIAVCKLANRTVWYLVDCYGGIKCFREYREWYTHGEREVYLAKLQSRVQKTRRTE